MGERIMIADEQIAEQLDAANGRLTELQQRLIEYASDADERGRIFDQIRATRREIDRLSTLQPTT
ncbi:hypothetical protein F7Q99_20105 [Streptomyces kaniharaensis]|uniref:Uncharacterized protein n=1 Tax=Streptomyces kaniharaensis TaxID=212423 RepID=A0A6N7KUK6_9ACTN|nr:hypothetical protein [Streptomyces kaniharaensis]MQS14505.1 hypothetical protein [Streptomyces kaniharaensis]